MASSTQSLNIFRIPKQIIIAAVRFLVVDHGRDDGLSGVAGVGVNTQGMEGEVNGAAFLPSTPVSAFRCGPSVGVPEAAVLDRLVLVSVAITVDAADGSGAASMIAWAGGHRSHF